MWLTSDNTDGDFIPQGHMRDKGEDEFLEDRMTDRFGTLDPQVYLVKQLEPPPSPAFISSLMFFKCLTWECWSFGQFSMHQNLLRPAL